jgi:uncharacterized protein (TIGR03435 family)
MYSRDNRPIIAIIGSELTTTNAVFICLTFAPETDSGFPPGFQGNGASDPAPTLGEAVKKYGLRVETRKAPVEIFIITRFERTPTEN